MVLSAAMSSGRDDAGDVEDAHFVVDAHLLRAADQEVAVGQNFRHHGGDRQVELLGAVDGALALGMGLGAAVQRGRPLARLGGDPEAAEAEVGGEAALGPGFARPVAGIVELGLVVDVDDDRQHVAELLRPEIVEEALVVSDPRASPAYAVPAP